MTWDKFKGGMVTLQIKYRLSPLPQSCVQMGVAALPNGMGHLSALRRPEGITRMGGRYVQFQHKAALRQADMLRSKGWNLNALVSCQTILPALIQDRADTSPEGASEKWNVGDRDHKGARFWKVVALQPQVGAWKRGSAVLFCIAQTAVKAVRASIQYKGAFTQAIRDPNVHGILGSICPTAVTDVPAVTDVVIQIHETYKHLGKPFIMECQGGEECQEAIMKLRDHGIPAYPTAEQAVNAMIALYKYGQIKKNKA